MLSQIIYARCRYYFDYNKNNKKFYFKEAEEFGWFNFSTDIQSKFPSIIDIVCSNLNDVVVNAADSEKEKLDIKNSFSYIKLKEKDRNVYVFIRLFVKQDKGSNTPTRFSRGNKHFLIGSLENSKCLPYQFLSADADCWAASSIKEEDFYDNNKNRPRLLDIDPAKINFKEELHLPKADSDKKPEKPNCLAGKTDLLKKITAFVFEQLSPEYTGPKRTLLIKDTPENLVLWIKAVSDILPLHWARELTFSTNVSDIDRKAQQRLQGTDGKLFFVIAGIDPKDASCANIPASQMYIVADPAAAPDKQFSYTSGLLEREFFKNLNLPNAGQRNPIEFWKKHPNLSPLEAINAYDAYLKVNKVSSDVIAHPEHLENYISEYSNFNDAETVQAFYKQLEIIFKDFILHGIEI